MDKILEVTNLKKYYKKKSSKIFSKEYYKSVDDVSFSIYKGEILGLVGESGCGKSTLAKTLLNLTKPTSGTVMFKGETIFNIEDDIYITKDKMNYLRKDMQIIFQDPYSSLNPRKTVEDIIKEGIIKHDIGNDNLDNYIKYILELCDISESLLDRYPHELSGGQRQRIGIARSLALKPEFIVCDEPTSALDVSVQSQILNLILDLQKKFSITYLFISHNLGIMKYICSRIMVMYKGKIVELAYANDIYNNPKHPYTQLLISSIPRSHPLEKSSIKEIIYKQNEFKNGCDFFDRCKYRRKECANNKPSLKYIDKNHSTACFLYQS